MALEIGSRLGHYDVTALIGEGGMGQVYQATDTKLNRQVALKILPEAFAADPDRLARFQREAQVLASLNHPNIAAIHGLEDSEGTKALVLELVEGPTLADRIAQGPIPIAEALPIAKQIAEALEAAHEAGVIHRDLKPANIKVRQDGTVKVLDFGLAKAFQPDANDPNLSQSPTISLTAAATQMGMVIGTAAYMAPEQAKGRPVNEQADIWAFGVVVFEMLAGQRPFTGEDLSDTLATVIKSDPDWDALPLDVPGRVSQVLRSCLQKQVKQRVHDMADVRLAMDGAFDAALSAAPPVVIRTSGWRQKLPLALALSAAAALIAGVAVWTVTQPTPGSSVRTTIPLPANVQACCPVVSPDGRTVAFRGTRDGVSQVYLRPLDQLAAVAVQGTEGTYPESFSPDGESLLVGDDQAPALLKRVPLVGGEATRVAEGYAPYGADWGPDGRIVLASEGGGLILMSAVGGEPTQLTSLTEGEVRHDFPSFLPNGRGILFHTWTADVDTAQVAVYDFEAGVRHFLFNGTSPRYASSGHLVFMDDFALWAVPFDQDRLEVTGSPHRLVEDVQGRHLGYANYSLSLDGMLVYAQQAGADRIDRSLVRVTRDGQEEPFPVKPRRALDLAPDGQRVALEFVESESSNFDILIYDLALGSSTRFAFDSEHEFFPTWTPDGTRIAFVSAPDEVWSLFWKPTDGTGQLERLMTSPDLFVPYDFTPDGRRLVFSQASADSGGDIGVIEMDGDGQTEMLIQTAFDDGQPSLSPDGRWIAYTNNESGRPELYVRPFPNVEGGLWPISRGEAVSPRWGPNGRELFYQTRERPGAPVRMMVAAIRTEPTFSSSEPVALFEGPYGYGVSPFDVFPDGQHLLIVKEQRDLLENVPLVVVQNWFEELKERVPIP
jgi:serine/threonine-protein kinase